MEKNKLLKHEGVGNMPKTKFTMVGMTSSGKTCYITAMYMKMAVGIDAFTLTTDEETKKKLERDIRILREPTGQNRFPSATQNNEESIRKYEFRLNKDRKEIITFEMMDYAGGALVDMGDVYSQVKKSIEESTALYIFIDGKSLCEDDPEERRENVFYDCALTVTPLLQDFSDSHNGYLPPVVFVVTKSDLCKNYVKDTELTSIIKDLFSPAFSPKTTSYICAISLGDTISDDDYKGKFKPVNVHLPFFLGSYHEYYNQYILLKNDVQESNLALKKKKIEEEASASKEEKRFFFFRNDNYIKERLAAAKEAEKFIDENNSLIDMTKELVIKFGSKLENESPNFKCFVNGVEQCDFRSYDV